MGAAHARGYSAAGAEIVGVADADETAAARLAVAYRARPVTTPEALFNLGLDAVSICLPHSLHHRCALMACERGIHILVEKPLAISIREALEIRKACRDSGIRCMVGFSQRFQDGFCDLKDSIQRDILGPIDLSVDYLSAGPAVPGWYLQQPAAGGGILITGSIHAVDRLRWLLNSEVRSVHGLIDRHHDANQVESTGIITLEFRSGSQAVLIGHRSSLRWHRKRHWFELQGSKGEAAVELNEASIVQRLSITTSEGTQERNYLLDDPFEREIAEFIDAIRHHRDPIPGLEDGVTSLAVIMAAYESARKGKTIYMESWEEAYKLC